MTSEKAGGPAADRTSRTATTTNQAATSIARDADSVDEILATVRRYEFAARAIADDNRLTVKARCKALLELMSRARRSEAPGLMESGVWRGCRAFFYPEPQPPRDVIAANHRLIRKGHSACPECRRPLPSIAELNRWRELGHDSLLRRLA